MSTAAIVAHKHAKAQQEERAKEEESRESLESPKRKKPDRAKRLNSFWVRKKAVDDKTVKQEELDKVANTVIPLRVILHVLRQKKKDELYVALAFYFVFMCCYTFVVYHSHHPFKTYTQNFGITEVIVNEPFNERDPTAPLSVTSQTSTHDPRVFTEIGESEEFWNWLEDVVVGKLFPEDCEKSSVAVQGQNYNVQTVRLRQARSKKTDVTIGTKTFSGWDEYSSSSRTTDEDSAIYGKFEKNIGNLQGFAFGSGNTNDYGNDGYITYFNRLDGNANVTAQMAAMKARNWLDDGTRMIALDMNFYNPTTDMVTSVRCGVEILPTGYITTYYFSYTWPRKPHDMTDSVSVARMFLEAYVFCFMMYLLVTEFKELVHEGFYHYFTIFNTVDFVSVLAMVGVVLCQIFFEYQWLDGKIDQEEYQNWFYLGELWEWKRNLVGFSFVMGWVKTFKYLEMNAKIKIIWLAIHKAQDDLLSTMMFFVILLLGFGSSGLIIFGNQVKDFSSITSTTSWLMRALLGDLDYHSINEFNPDVAAIYFGSYMVVVFFITLNLMIAIIIDGYEEAKQSVSEGDDDHDLLFIHDCLRTLMLKCSGRIKKFFADRKLKKLESRESSKVAPEINREKEDADQAQMPANESKSVVLAHFKSHNLHDLEHAKLKSEELKKRQPASDFKKKFTKAVMSHYEQLANLERIEKERMNSSEVLLRFDDLRALHMTGQQAVDVLNLYEKLAHMGDGTKIEDKDHEDKVPLTRQIARAIDSLQTQVEKIMVSTLNAGEEIPSSYRIKTHIE